MGVLQVPVVVINLRATQLESRKFQIVEIARIYRVPLHLLNELDKMGFSNIVHPSQELVVQTMRP